MTAVRRYNVTGTLDAAFRLYRQHFMVLFLISLGITVTWIVLAAGAGLVAYAAGATGIRSLLEGTPPLALVMGGALAILLLMIVFLVVWSFGVAATTRAASLAALDRRPSLPDAFMSALTHFATLLWASVLASALTIVVAAACVAPGAAFLVALGDHPAGFGLMLLFCIAGLVVYLVFQLGFTFIAPAVVVEDVGATTAIGRSWHLTRGRRWKILGVLLLVGILAFIAQIGATLAGHLAGLLGSEQASSVLGNVAGVAISVLAMPLVGLAQVLLYFDGRVDHEAFDVQMLAEAIPAQE